MILFLKILSLFVLTICCMRLMGKSTIIQMTPYDLVAIIIVGTIASEPLVSDQYLKTIAALLIVVGLHVLFSFFTLKQVGNRLFLGEPTLLVKNGVIVEDNLEKLRISVAQLLSILRSKGYPKLSDVEYALLEPIGEVSIIPLAENNPVTVQQMEISIEDEGIPISVIIDGRVQHKNLKLLGKSREWLLEHLRNQGVKEKDIIYAYVNEKTKKLKINKRSV